MLRYKPFMKADVRRLLHPTSHVSTSTKGNFIKGNGKKHDETLVRLAILRPSTPKSTYSCQKSAVGQALAAYFAQKASKRYAIGLTRKRSTHSSFPLSSDMKDFSAT